MHIMNGLRQSILSLYLGPLNVDTLMYFSLCSVVGLRIHIYKCHVIKSSKMDAEKRQLWFVFSYKFKYKYLCDIH